MVLELWIKMVFQGIPWREGIVTEAFFCSQVLQGMSKKFCASSKDFHMDFAG